MTDDMDKLEAVARAAQERSDKERHGRPWLEFREAFSPDVVLRLIERVRVAEAATKYLYDAWEDAEGQAGVYVFGPDAEMRVYYERMGETWREAPPEIQALVRRLCK